tara:strand:- start:1304 stop:2512 length:1209 start_codon:yes stop_codon:yes gene_type:complete
MYINSRSESSGALVEKLRSTLALIVLATFLVGCDSNNNSSSAPKFDPELTKTLETILVNNVEEYGIPGAVVGVWVPGKGELLLQEGESDLATNEPIDIEDHMRIGSVTKSFTVTVILQLVDEGLLRLDDPVSQFFPDIENSDATIAELANMRSGIFNYTEDADFVDALVENFLRVWLPQELVDVADRNAPYFAPDADWHYSNTSTVILGMIVEQLTGNPIGVEIEQRIIEPLELGGTLYPTSPDLPVPFSNGYLGAGPKIDLLDITYTDPSSSAGSGAMISRLLDLRIWAEALGEGTLLTAETQQERLDSLAPIVFDPCADSDPDRAPRICPEYDKYGIGIGELNGWVGHTGEGLGYTVLVMFEPTSSAVIVVMMNRSGVADHIHVPTQVFREYAQALDKLL